MKKLTRKVISLLLVATLIVSYSSVASASDMETKAKSAINVKTAKLVKTGAAMAYKANPTYNKIKVNNLTPSTKEENITPAVIAYTRDNSLDFGDNRRGFSQRIYLPAKGTIVIAAQALSNNPNGSVTYGLYTDAKLKNRVGSNGYNFVSDKKVTNRIIQVPKGGYYYLGYHSYLSQHSPDTTYNIATAVSYANGADRTLSNSKSVLVGQYNAQTNYFKFKATSTGYLKISRSATYKANITLLNSKKKAYSKESYGNTIYYGVQKGSTYYIKIKAPSNNDGAYILKVTNKAVKEKSGSKKSNAVTMAYNKSKTGTIIAGSSRSDYYKFKLTKKKKIKIIFKGHTNDKLTVKVYKGSQNVGSGNFYNSNKTLTMESYSKLPPGTYYVKISRANKYSSGDYKVYWKYY